MSTQLTFSTKKYINKTWTGSKPVVEKVIVGKDITVEEEKI